LVVECERLLKNAQQKVRHCGHVQNLTRDAELFEQAGLAFGSKEIFYL